MFSFFQTLKAFFCPQSFVYEKVENDERQIERLRLCEQRFANSLLGTWNASFGTSSLLNDEIWLFLEDGTGDIAYTGFGGRHQMHQPFEWRTAGKDFSVVIRFSEPKYLENEKVEEMFDWEEISYHFELVGTEVGYLPALVWECEKGIFLPSFEPLFPCN